MDKLWLSFEKSNRKEDSMEVYEFDDFVVIVMKGVMLIAIRPDVEREHRILL